MRQILRYSTFTYLPLLLFVVFGAFAQDSTPTDTISIEGTLLMLDDKTPHVAVVVQAIRDGKPVATVLSDEGGKYQFANLKPGTYQVRCYTLDGYLYYGKDKPTDASHAASLQVKSGRTLKDVDLRFAPFKKGTWKTYTHLDGLTDNYVYDIYRGPDAMMWFATGGGGISRYDGKDFVNFTTQDGLADNDVWSIYGDSHGVMWFGTGTLWTEGSGVSRYDGNEFVNFTTDDGLADSNVFAICRGPDGALWFGTRKGASRYDGKKFTSFTTRDGLAGDCIYVIYSGNDGVVWFGTGNGVSRWDGKGFVSFTTRDGLAGDWVNDIHCDPDGVMWFATVGGVSRYDGREFVNLTTEDGLMNYLVNDIYRDPDGVMWFATGGNTEPAFDGGVSRYDGKGFVNFTPADGLAGSMVYAVYGDPDGVMWFGTFSGGVSRYDSSGFVNFTREDGLLRGSAVLAVYADPDGTMWLGTSGGVSRYDGEEFVNFTTREGLVDNFVRTVRGGPENTIWFGTASGVSRYDGKDFVNFTIKDGLVGDDINDIHRTPDGTMWFGTWGDGISRYDGKEFVSFTEKDGLASNAVFAIQGDPDGVLWFGTWDGGASRYDGRDFVNFTIKDGLVGDDINDIHRTPDGALWFGARGGVSRYDGGEFLNFTIKDGLASNIVNEIYHDRDGVIWFSTGGGGVAGYDNTAWTSLDTRDGLAHNIVWSAYQNSNGDLWFGTYKGATRYRRSTTRPRVRIVSVTTDQTYRDLSGIPAFMPDTRVTFEYSSIDFKTIPEKRQYRCRIREIDSDWRKPTKSDTFDYIFGKSGTYTFEVQAIDRDLNYSEPASLALRVVPPFYLRAVFLVPTIGSGAIVLATVAFLATALTKRRRQVHAYELMAVRELQDAREMQMSLLPEAAPPVENIEIAGRSIPANTVGGDFFDYLVLADGKIGIAIADISGKGLRAAMNALMTSGMLYEVVKTEMSCGSVLSALNAGLYPRMEKQTFAAFSFATLSQDPERIQWSNAAQPRPLIKRDGAVSEFEGEGGLPLGMMPGVTYPDWELKLQAGDIVLLYTDGIIEAENEAEEMYGAERLERSVVSIDSTMGAEDIIEAILRDVSDFVGSAQQYDDMTVVVLKKL